MSHETKAAPKIDWHAIAKKEWAAGRHRDAAAAWTWALAVTTVTGHPELELERMLYLRNRSKAYLKTNQVTLALDDIEWVLRMQGVWDGSAIDIAVKKRHAYFVRCVAAYAAELERLAGTDASWLQSTAYMTKPDVFDVLFCRTLDDLEHFATALERFDRPRSAAQVYRLLDDVDGRGAPRGAAPDTARWAGHIARAEAAVMRGEAEQRKRQAESGPENKVRVRNRPHHLSATQRETLDAIVNMFHDGRARLEDMYEVWADWNAAARRHGAGAGDNEQAYANGERVWRLEASSAGRVASAPSTDTKQPGGKTAEKEKENEKKKKKKKTVVRHIECRWTRESGRGMYASRALAKGEFVWIEEPSAAATVDGRACVWCARHVSGEPVGCARCGAAVRYWADKCRDADTAVHAVLCGMDMREWQAEIAEHSVSTSSRTPHVTMRMLAQRVASAGSTGSAPSSSSSSSSGADPIGYVFAPVYAGTDVWTAGWLQTLRSTPCASRHSRDQVYRIYNDNRDRFRGHRLMHPQVYNFANYMACNDLQLLVPHLRPQRGAAHRRKGRWRRAEGTRRWW